MEDDCLFSAYQTSQIRKLMLENKLVIRSPQRREKNKVLGSYSDPIHHAEVVKIISDLSSVWKYTLD